ncbi:MAG: DUF2283 domain-containing protein [Cyanobacteria bacterium CRU_2_1]|nr:DUF2283 domain-containing protein [Cyanobacteria bacterium RU_5_0]NJR58945.1 DUF2283 domain-containing protein [Cyanobacteria bacterium CRU_2_1]
MKLTYDPRYNIAYIQLRETPKQVETIEVSKAKQNPTRCVNFFH